MSHKNPILDALSFLLVIFGPILMVCAYESLMHPLQRGPVMVVVQVALTIGVMLSIGNYYMMFSGYTKRR